jgi:hypothetical protein
MNAVNKIRKGQVKIFGKAIPIFIVAILLMAGTVGALLTVYITITGSATVAQSVVLNGFDSSWKYDASPTWTATEASWSVGSMVAGDEQDVGFKISNYAELDAGIELVATTTGPANSGYEKCKDVTIEIYKGYDVNPESETYQHCIGEKIADVSDCVDDVTTAYATVGKRPNINDPTTPTEQWFCARYIFDMKAVPGTYSFDLKIKPSSGI